MLGVLWSEHCSYKSSKPLLRRLPSTGAAVIQGPGENAGAVSIGEGWAVVFKIESHNHPSAIEPYQGAATGVGGIIRDVIAMGARPIALLDSLRFGPLPESGRDGIHGASFASVELDENSSERRPAVQVGNPFLEKCLLEACMDLSHTDAVVAIQDLGAAGLTSAVAECAGRVEGAGARIDVARVPRRERRMTPYDVMLSESQERMLVVVQRGREREVESIFHAWDLTSAAIGEVTGDGRLTVFDSRDQVARLPVRLLTDGAPMRRLVGVAPQPPLDLAVRALPPTPDAGAPRLRLLASANLASRRGLSRPHQ